MDKNTVFQGFARALLAIVLVAGVASVSACKDSGDGNAQAKAPEAEKAAAAIPVEVARESRQAVAASYPGPGALEASAASQGRSERRRAGQEDGRTRKSGWG